MNQDVYREFNNGWDSLFDELLLELKPYNVHITQAKEKYGELRVYVFPYVEEVENIINRYTEKSKTICEICGNEGKITDDGYWLKILCSKCYDKGI